MEKLIIIVTLVIVISGCQSQELPKDSMRLYAQGIVSDIENSGILVDIDTQEFFIETDNKYNIDDTVYIQMIVIYDIEIDGLKIIDTNIIN